MTYESHPSKEAAFLRRNWHWQNEVLSPFHNKWIAVLGQEIIASASTFEEAQNQAENHMVFEASQSSETTQQGPLYAFVNLGRIQ